MLNLSQIFQLCKEIQDAKLIIILFLEKCENIKYVKFFYVTVCFFRYKKI